MSDVKKRGFASLTQEKRKQIARLGGLAASASGKAHRFTHDEAIEAGKKSKKKIDTATL